MHWNIYKLACKICCKQDFGFLGESKLWDNFKTHVSWPRPPERGKWFSGSEKVSGFLEFDLIYLGFTQSFGCSSTIFTPAGWLKHVQIQANRADEASSLRSSSKCLMCWRLLFLARTRCDKTAMLRRLVSMALWSSQGKLHLIISQIFSILCFSDCRREIYSPRINYRNMAMVMLRLPGQTGLKVDEDAHPHSSHSSTELVSGDLKKLTASMFLF